MLLQFGFVFFLHFYCNMQRLDAEGKIQTKKLMLGGVYNNNSLELRVNLTREV